MAANENRSSRQMIYLQPDWIGAQFFQQVNERYDVTISSRERAPDENCSGNLLNVRQVGSGLHSRKISSLRDSLLKNLC
jgi:hypothetical protein